MAVHRVRSPDVPLTADQHLGTAQQEQKPWLKKRHANTQPASKSRPAENRHGGIAENYRVYMRWWRCRSGCSRLQGSGGVMQDGI
jgi:hypothetical protein